MKTQFLTTILFLLGTFFISNSFAQQIEVDRLPGQHSILLNDPGLSGLRVISPQEMGVYVSQCGHHGLFVYGPNNSGVHTYASQDDGAQLYNSADDGLHIKNSGGQGIEVDSGSVGVLIHNQTHGAQIRDCVGDGIQIVFNDDDGVYVDNVGDDGVFIQNTGDDGVYINNAGDDGIYINNAGGHGTEINGGVTGLYVHNQSNQGVYSYNSGLEAGFFRNAAVSNSDALYAAHLDDTKWDMRIGGHARVRTDGLFSIQLDHNNNGLNDNFEILRSAAQGGDYSFWVGEVGDAWMRRNFHCFGSISKGSGTFKIDHPLDPENKYLYHSFVESPDMMNVYNGNVVLNENGEATVQMEDWFEELNRDYRYQLTTIGGAALVYIAEEMANGSFKIAGGNPNMKVSWQVTGIRQDPFANQNRIEVEVEKEAYNKGKYVHPKAYENLGRGVNLKQITPVDPAIDNRDMDYEEATSQEFQQFQQEKSVEQQAAIDQPQKSAPSDK